VSKLKNSATDSAADLPFTVPEVAAEVGHWLSYLGAERRMSAKTVDAYQRDVRQFLDFLAMHLGSRCDARGLARRRHAGCSRLHGATVAATVPVDGP